jgi:hypothetical protein
MNMRIFNCLIWLFAGSVTLSSCKKEIDPDRYEVNPVELYSSIGEKTKLKSREQYVSILYTNLFQQALSGNQLIEVIDCLESIGDKELGREVLISNFMNKPGVQLPSDSVMRANPEAFVSETYERFFVREPTQAEISWFKNFINSNPQLTPELVYFSFALSNEYLYY